MLFGDITSLKDVDGSRVQDFEREPLYVGLEAVTIDFLQSIHPVSGVVSGGEGRPSLSPNSVFERDGEIARIAIANVSLASVLTAGSHMRHSGTLKVDSDLPDDDKIRIGTFFAMFIEAIVGWSEAQHDYEAITAEGLDFLKNGEEVFPLVSRKDLKNFMDSYETMQRCNEVSILCFPGPGITLRSRYVPVIKQCREAQKKKGQSAYQEALLDAVDRDKRELRHTKRVCLDSEREVVLREGKTVARFPFPFGKDVCALLLGCVRLAEKLIQQLKEDDESNTSPDMETFRRFRSGLGMDLVLGLFASDLSGNIGELYEDYVYSFLMRHFDEDEGAVGSLKAAEKRRQTVRRGRRGDKSYRTAQNQRRASAASRRTDNVEEDDEDWGPSSD